MESSAGPSTRAAADRLLAHLGLQREDPGLDYLHRLVAAHQVRVPFETLTKLLDYEPGLARGDFLPPFELYVDRIVRRGGGGLCWTLAHGFRTLLADLGFDASFLVMAPGHCCLRVDLPEGPFYADVGYAAPLERAYPLFESFTLVTARERFAYEVQGNTVRVTREPGPTKVLDTRPRTPAELSPLIMAANDWTVSDSFLRRLSYAACPGGVWTTLRDGTLRRHGRTGSESIPLAPAEIPAALADVFGADPALYTEAAAIQSRYLAAYPS